jgi:hypothetical protein
MFKMRQAARDEILWGIDSYVTGVSERSQRRSSLKRDVYKRKD